MKWYIYKCVDNVTQKSLYDLTGTWGIAYDKLATRLYFVVWGNSWLLVYRQSYYIFLKMELVS